MSVASGASCPGPAKSVCSTGKGERRLQARAALKPARS